MFLLLAITSLAAQVIGLLAIGFMLYDLLLIPAVLADQAMADTETIHRFILETVVTYRPWLGTGIVGAIATWLLILKDGYRASWYLKTTRVVAWIWFPLFPPGTVLAILLFSARAAASEEFQP